LKLPTGRRGALTTDIDNSSATVGATVSANALANASVSAKANASKANAKAILKLIVPTPTVLPPVPLGRKRDRDKAERQRLEALEAERIDVENPHKKLHSKRATDEDEVAAITVSDVIDFNASPQGTNFFDTQAVTKEKKKADSTLPSSSSSTLTHNAISQILREDPLTSVVFETFSGSQGPNRSSGRRCHEGFSEGFASIFSLAGLDCSGLGGESSPNPNP
jgi:hypothetical protein